MIEKDFLIEDEKVGIMEVCLYNHVESWDR